MARANPNLLTFFTLLFTRMKTSQTLRSQVLALATTITRQTKMPFGKAQKQAWATLKLTSQMHQKPVPFFYQKEDGTERFAIGFYGAIPTEPVTTDKPGIGLATRYYDVLAQGWRSFRADRLIIC